MRGLRNRHLLVLDAVLLSISPAVAYALRFEGFSWPEPHLQTLLVGTGIGVAVRLAIYWMFGLYSRLWQYASIAELEVLLVGGVTASVVAGGLGIYVLPALGITPVRAPYSVVFINGLLSIAIIAAPRLLIRMRERRRRSVAQKSAGRARRVLIAGAGAAGKLTVRELRESPALGLVPVGFLDDDPLKHRLHLGNLPVFGPLSMAVSVIARESIDELVIAMPSAPGTTVRELVRAAHHAGVPARTIPGLYELISGQKSVSALREVEIQDLLRREPIQTELAQVRELVTDQTVLVTGGGGSIGSELARQIAGLAPSTLVLLDHAENPIFYIHNELRNRYPELRIVPIIADVRDRRRIFEIVEQYRPSAVFHAAAHKHVPLMEENVIEAVTNNVRGTQNLVDAAVAAEVEHFVFISTDKAVRPTNVMGATKRIAEHVVRHAAAGHRRNFVAVRFGNVLGSQGSVVPTFMAQIKAGGPVTVTHPEMRRFFMTIPEAVQLVLQAAALGRGGELFMLDMGDPVKIVDLATDLIRLSGLEIGKDVDIEFTGMRPGEKLYEEMFFEHERALPTDHPKVLRAYDSMQPWEMARIEALITAADRGASAFKLRKMLQDLVPDFTPSGGPVELTPSFGLPALGPSTHVHLEPEAVADDSVLPYKSSSGH